MKPIAVVDAQEPIQTGDPYVVTLEVGDDEKRSVVWPQFCARCMKAPESRVCLERSKRDIHGGMSMQRVVRAGVPYCSACRPAPSRYDPSFHWAVLGGALVGLALAVITLVFSRTGSDWLWFGAILGVISFGFAASASYQIIRASRPPEAVGMSLNKGESKIELSFANPDYGRKFAELNHQVDDRTVAEPSGPVDSSSPVERPEPVGSAGPAEPPAPVYPPSPVEPPAPAEPPGPMEHPEAQPHPAGEVFGAEEQQGFPSPPMDEDTSPSIPDFVAEQQDMTASDEEYIPPPPPPPEEPDLPPPPPATGPKRLGPRYDEAEYGHKGAGRGGRSSGRTSVPSWADSPGKSGADE